MYICRYNVLVGSNIFVCVDVHHEARQTYKSVRRTHSLRASLWLGFMGLAPYGSIKTSKLHRLAIKRINIITNLFPKMVRSNIHFYLQKKNGLSSKFKLHYSIQKYQYAEIAEKYTLLRRHNQNILMET